MAEIESYHYLLDKTYQRKGTQDLYTVAHLHESGGKVYITISPLAGNPHPSSLNITEEISVFLNTYGVKEK